MTRRADKSKRAYKETERNIRNKDIRFKKRKRKDAVKLGFTSEDQEIRRAARQKHAANSLTEWASKRDWVTVTVTNLGMGAKVSGKMKPTVYFNFTHGNWTYKGKQYQRGLQGFKDWYATVFEVY